MSQLAMELSGLERLTEVTIPDGYSIRNFRSGDERGLARVFADGALGLETPAAVEQEFLRDSAFRPHRVFVVEFQGEIVGTAAMWTSHDDSYHAYLHMVAVLKAHRGKHLGWALSTEAARHAGREGYKTQRLFTDDFREPAIRLYLDMGYRPLYLDTTHPARWAKLASTLQRPWIPSLAKRGHLGRPKSALARLKGRVKTVLVSLHG